MSSKRLTTISYPFTIDSWLGWEFKEGESDRQVFNFHLKQKCATWHTGLVFASCHPRYYLSSIFKQISNSNFSLFLSNILIKEVVKKPDILWTTSPPPYGQPDCKISGGFITTSLNISSMSVNCWNQHFVLFVKGYIFRLNQFNFTEWLFLYSTIQLLWLVKFRIKLHLFDESVLKCFQKSKYAEW